MNFYNENPLSMYFKNRLKKDAVKYLNIILFGFNIASKDLLKKVVFKQIKKSSANNLFKWQYLIIKPENQEKGFVEDLMLDGLNNNYTGEMV